MVPVESSSSATTGIAGVNEPVTNTVSCTVYENLFKWIIRGFVDSQGMSPQRETIARISLFFAGENRRYTASCFLALWSWSDGRRGDSSEAMIDVNIHSHLHDTSASNICDKKS